MSEQRNFNVESLADSLVVAKSTKNAKEVVKQIHRENAYQAEINRKKSAIRAKVLSKVLSKLEYKKLQVERIKSQAQEYSRSMTKLELEIGGADIDEIIQKYNNTMIL